MGNVLEENSKALLPSREERRKRLLEAADAVVRRRGAASMDQIAAEAGITKPILYRHFGDKGGLVAALAERYVGLLMAQLQKALANERNPSGRESLAVTIDAYVRFVERNASAYKFVMKTTEVEPQAQIAIQEFIRRVGSEIANGLKAQLDLAGVMSDGAEAWAFGMVGMVQVATDWWLEARPFPRSKLVEYLVMILWRGFYGLSPNVQRPVGVSKKGEKRG